MLVLNVTQSLTFVRDDSMMLTVKGLDCKQLSSTAMRDVGRTKQLLMIIQHLEAWPKRTERPRSISPLLLLKLQADCNFKTA